MMGYQQEIEKRIDVLENQLGRLITILLESKVLSSGSKNRAQCCPVCGGRQQITSREDGLIPVDAHGMCGPQYVSCPACGGTGIVWADDGMSQCGTGGAIGDSWSTPDSLTTTLSKTTRR